MIRFSDTPIWLRLTGAIWLMMVAAFGSMIVWETRVNRDMAIEQAKDFAGQLGALGCRLCITEVHSGANPIPDLVHLRPQLVRIADVLSRVLGDNESTNTVLKPLIEALHREQIAPVMPNVDSASTLAVLWQLGLSFIEGDYLQSAQPQMSYDFTDLN